MKKYRVQTTTKYYQVEAPATQDWCGCCDRPSAVMRLKFVEHKKIYADGTEDVWTELEACDRSVNIWQDGETVEMSDEQAEMR